VNRLTHPEFSLRRALLPVLAVIVACAPQTSVSSAPAPIPAPEMRVEQAGEIALPAFRQQVQPTITPADLDRRTAELFGEAQHVESMRVPFDSGLMGADAEPTWDIDVRSYETLARVQHYVGMFTGEARARFVERLSRGTRYESMIRARLRAGDLPEDMYYLALIESNFNPHAYSRAAAVGMWQFMSSTARGMGLRVDWWIDERRDPVRSTEAAVGFLRGLREQFGSMYLAAAAYNGGPGRVARGLSRYADQLEGTTGDDAFFALAEKKYLRNETREYVPQLVAAALVAKDSARYGLAIQAQPPFEYDSVKVGPRVPLAAIAEASGTTVAVLQELNSHILRGMTPPRDSLKVRIPLGTRLRFDSAYALLPAETLTGATTVITPKGATWSSLARKSKVSARVVSTYNPTVKASKKTGIIPAGTPVLIPTPAVVAAAMPVPDPSIERYGRGTRTHVVRSGENLSVIANRYRTTPAAIMRLNRLKKPLIFPGQELLVAGRPASSSKGQAKRATASKAR
jgi:membrane-bound lytic murein transglycosylase D